MKMVLYKTCFGYACTSESNYKAYIQNARKIHSFDSVSHEEAIEIMNNNFGTNWYEAV